MLMFDISGRQLLSAFRKASIISRPATIGCPCFPWLVSGNDRPFSSLYSFEECVSEFCNAGIWHRRTIDQRDHGRVPASVQHFAQTNSQGTELSARGIGIRYRNTPIAYTIGRKAASFFPATTNTISL